MTILCYHSIQPGWSSPLAVEPSAFDAHCAWLSRRRQVLPLSQAIDRLDSSYRLPRGLAALTFDDGFEALHEHALPAFRKYRLPATVFLVAQTLSEQGRPVDWVDTPPAFELHTLSRDQVLEMQAAGVDFQSHSYAHLDLTALTFSECVQDLQDSRELLESLLGRAVRLLAYPRGRHNEQVRAAAAKAGYSHGFALPEGSEPSGPYAIPRVGLYHGNAVSDLRVKSARMYLPLRTGSAFRRARQLRHRLRRRGVGSHG